MPRKYDDLIEPLGELKTAPASGALRDFILKHGNADNVGVTTDAEEARLRAERKEAERKARRTQITITLGTAERIDSVVYRLQQRGLRIFASRDKVIASALDALERGAMESRERA